VVNLVTEGIFFTEPDDRNYESRMAFECLLS